MFIGTTGFGKTYLAAHALAERKYIVVHDAKRTFREKDWIDDEWDVCDTVDAAVRSRKERICYSPTRFELRDADSQERFFEWVLRRGNTTCYVDELTLVTDGQSMPQAMQDIFATGREPGVELWCATQQPVFVPNLAFTQSRTFYVFYCALGAHRAKVASFVPLDPDQIADLRERQYFYYRDTWRQAVGPCELVEEEEPASSA